MEAKTVIDAVNESRGGRSNIPIGGIQSAGIYVTSFDSDYIYYGSRCIATMQEFKQLVFELETNSGRSITYDKYKLQSKILANFNKKPNSVFTQAMSDAGELPSVGMECRFYNKITDYDGQNPIVTIDFINNQGALIKYHDSGLNNWITDFVTYGFKPITPPKTDEEILIEDLKHLLPEHCWQWVGVISKEIMCDKIHSVTFTGSKS